MAHGCKTRRYDQTKIKIWMSRITSACPSWTLNADIQSHIRSRNGSTCRHVQAKLWMLISRITAVSKRIDMSTCPSWTLNNDMLERIFSKNVEVWNADIQDSIKIFKVGANVKHFAILVGNLQNGSSVKWLESVNQFVAWALQNSNQNSLKMLCGSCSAFGVQNSWITKTYKCSSKYVKLNSIKLNKELIKRANKST